MSLACANVVLVHHGRRAEQPIDPVPGTPTAGLCVCDGSMSDVVYAAGVSRPARQRVAFPVMIPSKDACLCFKVANISSASVSNSVGQLILERHA